MTPRCLLIVAFVATMALAPAGASQRAGRGEASESAARPGPPPLDWHAALRTRLEHVVVDGASREAWAPTARLRLGASARASDPRFSMLIELEAIAGFGGRYDSGANDGQAYPAVIDPTGLEVNQAAVAFRTQPFAVAAGRQRLLFENQRFIGNSDWRQNEQTFDAVDVTGIAAGFAWRYAWLDRVHRVAGDHARVPAARERGLDGHALHLARVLPGGKLVAYTYLIEDRTLPAASTRTHGLRWSSDPKRRLGVTAELAQQYDYAQSATFSHGYRLLEASAAMEPATWRVGVERLDGDGHHAFQTPLATLHAFNGWADVFTTTPVSGLEDRYLAVGGTSVPWQASWNVAVHDFRATYGDAALGREIDASVGRPLGRGWNLLAKVAHYEARGFARDSTKAWLQLEWTR